MFKKRTAVVTALLVAATSLTVSATSSGAAPTTPTLSRSASPGDDDPVVKAWKEKILKQAKATGDDAPVFKSAQYVIDPERSPAVKKSKANVTPQASTAYPVSGCTLQMVTYHDKSVSPSYVRASSLTSCLSTAGTIKHTVTLKRLDWWGWSQRASGNWTVYNTSSLAYTISNRCSDGNYNSWEGYVHGDLWRGGYYYYADEWDEKALYCGGS